MSHDPASAATMGGGGDWFATTHWSVVLTASHGKAPDAREALETLCHTYWFPLYAYVRRHDHSPEDAQDLTQEFFARFLEKKSFGQADPERGRFRAFLLTALKNFLVSEKRRNSSTRRGGGQPVFALDAGLAERHSAEALADAVDPETIYEKRWAIAVMERVLTALREEHVAAGKTGLFDRLADRLWGETTDESYRELASEFGMTEGALKQCAHRLREPCRELLRSEVAHTVSRPEEIDEELRYLVSILRK